MDESKHERMSLGELLKANLKMRPVLVDKLLRVGETMNIIAPPKTGKSLLAVDLAVSVATGRPWLGFPCEKGKVLIIDNELREASIADRLRNVCAARGVPLEDVEDSIVMSNQRGCVESIDDLGNHLEEMKRHDFRLIIIDSFYRALPKGLDVSDRAAVCRVYNLIDSYAAKLGCAFVLVHHAFREDVVSRAEADIAWYADTHVELRPTKEKGSFVMKARVRSFPPLPSVHLFREFPVWNRE